MGHPWRTKERKQCSPLTVLAALQRLAAGHNVSELAGEYGVDASTLFRWRTRYGKEAAAVASRVQNIEQLRQFCCGGANAQAAD